MDVFGQTASLSTRAGFLAGTPPLSNLAPGEKAGQNDWQLWQLADSAFPTGGFAHSGGLEAAWQHGELANRAALAAFIEASLRQFGRGSLPLVTGAYDEPERLNDLDRLCENFLINHVANRASRLQGRALLASTERIFGASAPSWSLRSADRQPPYGHLAPVFGALAAHLHLGREQAARLSLFLHLRGLLASAVRLGIVGPLEAQALQHRLGSQAEEILQQCQDLPAEEIAQTAPLLDLWQGAQDRLYSRLFQS